MFGVLQCFHQSGKAFHVRVIHAHAVAVLVLGGEGAQPVLVGDLHPLQVVDNVGGQGEGRVAKDGATTTGRLLAIRELLGRWWHVGTNTADAALAIRVVTGRCWLIGTEPAVGFLAFESNVGGFGGLIPSAAGLMAVGLCLGAGEVWGRNRFGVGCRTKRGLRLV